MTLRSISIAAVAALMTGPVMAADLPSRAPPPVFVPPPPVFTWTGFYIGVNVGGGFGQTTGNRIANTPDFAPAIASGQVPGALGLRPVGILGGGQFGYNWQTNIVVFGFEADIQASGIRRAETLALGTPALPSIVTASDRLSWFGTARGRLGITPINPLLLYVTGGLAYGGVRDSGSVTNPAAPASGFFTGAANQIRVGWTIGAGAEYKITQNLSLKAEYLYVDLGRTNVTWLDITGAFPASSVTYGYRHRENIARLGLNYKFDWAAPPPPPVVAKY